MKTRRANCRRGMTLVEVLIAALIFALCLAAMTSVWYVSLNITVSHTNKAVAYNLARQTMESIKETGFYNTAEAAVNAPAVRYYDPNMADVTNAAVQGNGLPAGARYKVATSVVSDYIIAGSNPVKPADTALRTVTVTVTLAGKTQTIQLMHTDLARAGI